MCFLLDLLQKAIFSCRGFRICARIYRSNQGFYSQMLTLVPRYRNAFALIGFMQEVYCVSESLDDSSTEMLH